MRNVTLVGFMGTGKTTTGRLLAKKLGFDFVDVDDEVEKEQGVSISSIFSELGEPYFRMLERDMIKALSKKTGLVISAGGGAVLDTRNVDTLKEAGPVICLAATPETIFKRVGNSKNRPLLQVPDPMGKINELLAARASFYSRADATVDTSGLTPDEVVSRLMHIIQDGGGLVNG